MNLRQRLKEYVLFMGTAWVCIAYDWLSTYLGVCIYGAAEGNSKSIAIAASHGYLSVVALSFSQITIIGSICFVFYAYYRLLFRPPLWAVPVAAFLLLVSVIYYPVIINNSNELGVQITGVRMLEPVKAQGMPYDELKELHDNFDMQRQDFCSLLP